jgi:hypothetical protein
MPNPIKCLTNIVKYDPNFFIIFINDIVIDIQSTIKLFADDTSLYLMIDNPQTMADILNRDLDKIQTSSTNWLVSFNPQKTETMTQHILIMVLCKSDIWSPTFFCQE